MASILKVDTITGVATAGSIAITGEGNSTTTNLQQGLAKAWSNLDGTGTIALLDSLNIASITDHGTGTYTETFSNSFNNAFYAMASTNYFGANADATLIQLGGYGAPASGSVKYEVKLNGASGYGNSDVDQCHKSYHGDLA